MADRDEADRIAPSLGIDGRPAEGSAAGRPREERLRRWPKLFHAFHDEVAFEGIPVSEFTPAVQAAFSRIMGEYDELHRRYDQALEHQKLLEKAIDRHVFLPVLNQHALLRELARILDVGEQMGVAGTFVLLHLRNALEIRRRHGIGVLQATLAAATEGLLRELRTTDLVGGIGDMDLAVVLTLADRDAARAKAEALARHLEAGLQIHDGSQIRLAVAFGIHRLVRGETPALVLDRAERDLRLREDRSAGLTR